ncbi:MAG: NosD domain-containing protein [Candidatus Odinarchaeota archaeon]
MHISRKKYTELAVLLLIIIFPAVLDLSNNRTVDSDHQARYAPVVQTKLNSIQSQPAIIPITSNNGFIAAGFSGYGNVTHPYVLDGNIYGRIEAGGPPGINISNTDAYFRIENVRVNGSTNGETAGIQLVNVTNGQIINSTVTNSTYGFILDNSNFTILTGNTANDSTWDGFSLMNSNNNTLTGNFITGNAYEGFYLYESDNNTLLGNNASEIAEGFYLEMSSYNNLIGNNASGNLYNGFFLDTASNNSLTGNIANNNDGPATGYGFYLWESTNNSLTGNSANGNTMSGFYLFDSYNNTFTGNTANNTKFSNGFHISASHYCTFTGNTANDNGEHGFYVTDCHYSTLTGNTASGNNNGFSLDGGQFNSLTGNTASGNIVGFYLSDCQYFTLTGNTANDNAGVTSGFYLTSCQDSTFTGNTANGNSVHGFQIRNSYNNNFTGNTADSNNFGFYLYDSDYNNLTGNAASNNNEGFSIFSSSFDSDFNIFTWNTIYNNTGYGIEMNGAKNEIYLNFFINNSNTPQAYDDSLDNSWNGSMYGNYWSDYTGMDTVGNDGIGDTNYTLAGTPSVNDTLPLVAGILSDLSTLQASGPGNQLFEAGSTGTYTISWLPVTNIQVNTTYKLYIDDSLEDSGNWTAGTAIQWPVDLASLVMDTEYNYTLVVTDYSNKTVTDTVLLMVKDRTDPVITAIAGFAAEAGPDAGVLAFNATDLYSDTYTLYLDDAVNKTDSWTSGTVVTVQLENLPPGVYNFTLVVLDTSGNGATLTVLVTLEDTVDPVITYTGTETITFEEGSTGNAFNITATDLYPGNFTLYQNGTGVGTYNWTSGTTVTVSFDGLSLPVGVYNFTLNVLDTSGNGATLMVTVTVTAKPAPSTTTTTTTPTSSSSVTTTTTGEPSPGWTAPLVLLSLACSATILTRRRSRRKN